MLVLILDVFNLSLTVAYLNFQIVFKERRKKGNNGVFILCGGGGYFLKEWLNYFDGKLTTP